MALTTYVRQIGTRQAVLCLVSGFVAIWAFAGALGLITGVISLGTSIDNQIPFHSPVFGGVMLAVVVGVPMLTTGVLAIRADERTPIAAITAGAALIGWIAVQVAIIGELSWLQPVCVGFGLLVQFLGIPGSGRVPSSPPSGGRRSLGQRRFGTVRQRTAIVASVTNRFHR
ncbi:hypothetical protein [Nocardia sp. NPDC049149]|uniref:hypothetical protein n=1 Tax=Nocardia sp. NPDC049149 TaxID=3364315 RepID=UPI00371C2D93